MMRRMAAWTAKFGLTALFVAAPCIAPQTATGQPASDWATEIHADHPLVGAIWLARDRRTVGREEAFDLMAQSQIVILGETHDNPDHHRFQAEALEALVERGRQSAVVFEMIPRHLQDRLDAHLREHPDDVEGLGAAVAWERRGWPEWQMYQPIAEVARDMDLALHAGGLDDELQRKLVEGGLDDVGEQERQRLGLVHELSPGAASSLDEELFQAHCELLPREALPRMRLIQWARDGAMAHAVGEAAEEGPVVLIAGAGHARRDWGVLAQLAKRKAHLDVASVAIVEVVPQETDPHAYLPVGADDLHVFDMLVFTPRAERDDPCVALEERLEN
jgi:uncharacterized iron-regulated protein